MRLPTLLCAALLLGLPPRPAGAEPARSPAPRLRFQDARSARIFDEGMARSRLLAELAARVDAGDVFVYVSASPGLDRSLAGSVIFVGAGGGYRYLSVRLNPTLTSGALIATLAHELQHVVEVIEAPEVRSPEALTELYERIGHPTRAGGRPGWDTVAAEQMTLAVRQELMLDDTDPSRRRSGTDQLR
ncbi:MAG: hypothetical protein AB1635_03335 [Acidobacteriota bacterium]